MDTETIKARGNIPRVIGAVVIAVFLAYAGCTSSYKVDQGERAVVLTNGRVSSVQDAGLHFKLPFFQSVKLISTRTVTRVYQKVATYTSDRQTAEVQISVTFAIDPAKVADVYSQYGEDGNGSRTATIILDPKLYESFKNIFGQYNAVAVVQRRTDLNAEIQQSMIQETLGSGLLVKSVQIQNVDFSDAYERAIEQSAEAQAAVQTATNRLEMIKMESQQQIVQAEAAAKALRAKAEAEAYQTTIKGNAEASAISARAAALKQNADLVALSAVEKWDGVLPTTMVPGSALPFVGIK